MVSGCTKRVVVIRNIPSNFIEEAILILKSEPDDKEKDPNAKDTPQAEKKLKEDHLLKEAELIINNYIKENKLHVEKDRQRGRRRGALKTRLTTNVFINLALIGSIVFLIMLFTRIL